MMYSSDELPVNLEQGFMIADKIADCHEAAIRLFGDEFCENTQPIRAALNALMDGFNCSAVTAGLDLLLEIRSRGDLNGMAIMLVCAVVYDLSETGTDRSRLAIGGGPADSDNS